MFDSVRRQGRHDTGGARTLRSVDEVVAALAAQQAELAGVLDSLTETEWRAPTRCTGWDVSDVVLHLVQTDEMAVASAQGRFAEHVTDMVAGAGAPRSVDEGAARLVERGRGLAPADLQARWRQGAAHVVAVLDAMNLSTRVTWVAGELAARTLATTRLAETWIHSGDVADAVGVTLVPTERLRLVARLAWRTLPYAFTSAGHTMAGGVALHLIGPDGEEWDFAPDGPVSTVVTGRAEELCAVAARRIEPTATSLHAEGPDAQAVLALIRTYA
jgi:uncharacterized protein (TIGR03084 family)